VNLSQFCQQYARAREALLPPRIDPYQIWRGEFAKATDETLYPMAWMDREIEAGRFLLDHTADAAVVTGIKHYPSGLFDVEGIVAAGNAETIVGVLIPTVVERARQIGASGALIESRSGWLRLLKGQGFEPHQTSIRRALP